MKSKPNTHKKTRKQEVCFEEKNSHTNKVFLKREKQVNKIKDEKWDITMNTAEIQKVIRNYYEELHVINWRPSRKWMNVD